MMALLHLTIQKSLEATAAYPNTGGHSPSAGECRVIPARTPAQLSISRNPWGQTSRDMTMREKGEGLIMRKCGGGGRGQEERETDGRQAGRQTD